MSELSEQDVEKIEEIHNLWIKEELARNSSQTIELCADDVTWIPPDAPPLVGKQAIAKYLNDNAVDLKDVQIKDVLIRGSDTLAFLTSDYYSRFAAAGANETQEATGTHLWVLRKTRGGVWQVAVVAWSSWKAIAD